MLGGIHLERQDLYNTIKSYQKRESEQKKARNVDPLLNDKIKNPSFKYPETNLILNLGTYSNYVKPVNNNRQAPTIYVRPRYNPDDYKEFRKDQVFVNPVALGMSRTPKGNVGPIYYY